MKNQSIGTHPTGLYTVVWINQATRRRGYLDPPMDYESARRVVERNNRTQSTDIQYAECSPGELAHFKRAVPGYSQDWA